ncbi:DUF3558 domain-containing protein [Nocardia sp. NPDC051832]|uniref:DUF3558 domain-containing protein n=1 Tax=Nocardia sp. NPDC051832 TaxID=3155673 RepID=UPI00341C7ED5
MKKTALTALLFTTALTIVACNSNEPDATPTSATPPPSSSMPRPQVAVSVPAAPPQKNKGRNAVAFDPCVDVGDSTITDAGFNPRSRERDDFTSDFYSFRGCKFTKGNEQGIAVRYLTVQSTNITMAEVRERYGSDVRNTSIAGRDAAIYRIPGMEQGACLLSMQTRDGSLHVNLGVAVAFSVENPCDAIPGVAEKLAPALINQ